MSTDGINQPRSETGCMGDPDTELRLAGVHSDQDPTEQAQMLRDRLETAIRARLDAAWPNLGDDVLLGQVAAVAAVAAADTLLGKVDEVARLRADLDSTQQVATFRQSVIDRYRADLGAAGDVLAVVRDAVERIERALATYDTQPTEANQ